MSSATLMWVRDENKRERSSLQMKGYRTTIGFVKKLAEAKKEIDCPFVEHLRNLGGVRLCVCHRQLSFLSDSVFADQCSTGRHLVHQLQSSLRNHL